MDTTWIASKLAGTVTRGVMWALAAFCAYLSTKGISATTPDSSAVQNTVTGILTFALPIIASWWSMRNQKTLQQQQPLKS